MKALPTDLAILDGIYERYYETFGNFSRGDSSRTAKVYVPIDIDLIARDLGVDSDIVFGRLYYYLEKKHGYTQDDGSKVHFFGLRVGNDVHCVNFPYVASVLAQLRDENKKHRGAMKIAIFSLLVSLAALMVSVLLKTWRGTQ